MNKQCPYCGKELPHHPMPWFWMWAMFATGSVFLIVVMWINASNPDKTEVKAWLAFIGPIMAAMAGGQWWDRIRSRSK